MDDLFGSPTSGPTKGGAMDPAAEFAARERAALGADDAGLLAGGADANSSGGAGAFPSMDDFEARAGAFPDLDLDDGAARGASPAVGVDDDFGGLADRDDAPVLHQQPSSVSVTNDNEIAAFESQYPEVEPLSQQQQPELGQPVSERRRPVRTHGHASLLTGDNRRCSPHRRRRPIRTRLRRLASLGSRLRSKLPPRRSPTSSGACLARSAVPLLTVDDVLAQRVEGEAV